jgi:hypothetical protein
MGPREIKIYGVTVTSNDVLKVKKTMMKPVSNITFYTGNLLCSRVNFVYEFQQSSNAERKGKENLNTTRHDEFWTQTVCCLGEAITSRTLPNAVINL